MLLCLVAGCADPEPYRIDPLVEREGERVVVRVHGEPGAAFRLQHPSTIVVRAEGTLDANGDADVRLDRWRGDLDGRLEIFDPEDPAGTRVAQEVAFRLAAAWDRQRGQLRTTVGGVVWIEGAAVRAGSFPPGARVTLGDAAIPLDDTGLALEPRAALAELDLSALSVADGSQEMPGALVVELPDGQRWEGRLRIANAQLRSLVGVIFEHVDRAPVELPPATGGAVLEIAPADRRLAVTVHGAVRSLADIAEVALVVSREREVAPCLYEGGHQIPRRVVDYTLTVYAPRDGRRLASHDVPATGLPACPETVHEGPHGETYARGPLRSFGDVDARHAWVAARAGGAPPTDPAPAEAPRRGRGPRGATAPRPAPARPPSAPAVARSAADIRATVARHTGAVRACYERGLARRPELAGRVTLAWDIQPDGSVAGARVESSTLSEPTVERCLVGALSRARFTRAAEPQRVRYPFELRP